MDCENNTEMKNNMNNTSMDIMKKMKRVVDLQKEVIDLQEEEINDFNEKKRKIIESFNNLDSLENLYEKDLNEKVEKHKYRVKAYNQFIFKHGMQEFTNMLIKAHDNSEYLQNFREFINFCDEEVKEKIEQDISKRELEMTKGIYIDYMPLLNPEKVVNHMVYLDKDFGESLNELDKLIA
jgi:hypothetical protein